MLRLMHRQLRSEFALDDIRTCYHDDATGALVESRCLDVCTRPPSNASCNSLPVSWSVIAGGTSAPAAPQAVERFLVNAFAEATRVEPEIELPDLAAAAGWILKQGPGS